MRHARGSNSEAEPVEIDVLFGVRRRQDDGISFGWMVPTSAFGSVVRNAKRSWWSRFLDLPNGRPGGPDAGEAGEGTGLMERAPDITALGFVEFTERVERRYVVSPKRPLMADCVAKVVLQEASKILSAAGAFFV